MDTKVLTRDNWTYYRNTYRAAHDYSIKMQVGAAKTDYLIVFYTGEYFWPLRTPFKYMIIVLSVIVS